MKPTVFFASTSWYSPFALLLHGLLTLLRPVCVLKLNLIKTFLNVKSLSERLTGSFGMEMLTIFHTRMGVFIHYQEYFDFNQYQSSNKAKSSFLKPPLITYGPTVPKSSHKLL